MGHNTNKSNESKRYFFFKHDIVMVVNCVTVLGTVHVQGTLWVLACLMKMLKIRVTGG